MNDVSVPPAGPLMCFWCLIARCKHRHCPGNIPATTTYRGTSLCFDCASSTENS